MKNIIQCNKKCSMKTFLAKRQILWNIKPEVIKNVITPLITNKKESLSGHFLRNIKEEDMKQ